jgi:hypothetical protein
VNLKNIGFLFFLTWYKIVYVKIMFCDIFTIKDQFIQWESLRSMDGSYYRSLYKELDSSHDMWLSFSNSYSFTIAFIVVQYVSMSFIHSSISISFLYEWWSVILIFYLDHLEACNSGHEWWWIVVVVKMNVGLGV